MNKLRRKKEFNMNTRTIKNILQAVAIFIWTGCGPDRPADTVKIMGEMKNVMWKGELEGNIHLDTIANKTHLYGLGPVEYLTGETLILDGRAYQSTVLNDTVMRVTENYDLKAPFFAYTNISEWKDEALPDSVQTIPQLEQYLDAITRSATRPFMFKLSGTVEEALIHVVNLPKGSSVSSPQEAHQGQVDYKITQQEADIVGFFSKEHQTIFTHHDTFLHMHLITSDRKLMGHLDEIVLQKRTATIYLPAE